MDYEATVGFFAFIIWVCEICGGLEAVSFTDTVQSVIMILSLIALPCIVHSDIGGAAAVVEFGCGAHEVINCSDAAFKIEYPDAECTSAATADAFDNGCLAYNRPYWTLHPVSTKWGNWDEAWWCVLLAASCRACAQLHSARSP